MLLPFHDNNPIRCVPWMALLLIAINIVIHAWISNYSIDDQNQIYARYGFVPKRISQLSDPNIKVEVDITPLELRDQNGQPNAADKKIVKLEPNTSAILFSLVSCMFLHGDWFHLLSNMWFLWLFGNNIEDRLGHFIFLLFYLVVGWLGTACQWAVSPDAVIPVVGASGAIAGILGAYAVTFPKARVKTLVVLVIFFTVVELPALFILFAWFAIQLIAGTASLDGNVAGVAWWVHVGGFLAGVFLMPLMAMGAPEPGSHWQDEVEQEFETV